MLRGSNFITHLSDQKVPRVFVDVCFTSAPSAFLSPFLSRYHLNLLNPESARRSRESHYELVELRGVEHVLPTRHCCTFRTHGVFRSCKTPSVCEEGVELSGYLGKSSSLLWQGDSVCGKPLIGGATTIYEVDALSLPEEGMAGPWRIHWHFLKSHDITIPAEASREFLLVVGEHRYY